MNYRVEYREAGRRRWRVAWEGYSDLAGEVCTLYRTFRTRGDAERWMYKKQKPTGSQWEWRPVV
jgi:hypothetical protein